jgi:hypothetical protein
MQTLLGYFRTIYRQNKRKYKKSRASIKTRPRQAERCYPSALHLLHVFASNS